MTECSRDTPSPGELIPTQRGTVAQNASDVEQLPTREPDLTEEQWGLWKAWGRARNRLPSLLDDLMLRSSGIRMHEFAVLNAVHLLSQEQNDARIIKVAHRIGISASRCGRIVDSLSARGLCERSSDASDGRAVQVALTERGEELLTTATPHQALLAQHFLIRHIPPESYSIFLAVFSAIAETEPPR